METAILKVLSDLLADDSGDVAVLALLDVSAAFDTVDHEILFRRLEVTFGITGAALATVVLDRQIPVRSSRCRFL
jgi:hypothetical protein